MVIMGDRDLAWPENDSRSRLHLASRNNAEELPRKKIWPEDNIVLQVYRQLG